MTSMSRYEKRRTNVRYQNLKKEKKKPFPILWSVVALVHYAMKNVPCTALTNTRDIMNSGSRDTPLKWSKLGFNGRALADSKRDSLDVIERDRSGYISN